MFLPSSAFSTHTNEYEQIWAAGDMLVAAHICRTEEDIMKVILADTKSEEETIALLFALSSMGRCHILRPPTPFRVHSVTARYVDYDKRPSVVLALQNPAKDTPEIFAYAIAMGGVKKVRGI